jgi:hypothetical protein
MWLWNLGSRPKGRTSIEGVGEESREGDGCLHKIWQLTSLLRKLRNEELRKLYSSPNIIKIMKSRKLRRAQYVACMERVMKYIRSFTLEI